MSSRSRASLYPLLSLLLLLLGPLGTPPLRAQLGPPDPEASLVAVVTHKAGIAARLAHDHLVVAPLGDTTTLDLSFDPARPETTRFVLETEVEGLVVDDGMLQEQWYPWLEGLAVLEEPFSEISAKDRGKIRQAMLGEEQLDAADHPTLIARLVALEPAEATEDGSPFDWRATVELTIRGESHQRPLAARFELSPPVDGDETRYRLVLEAVGTFRFGDFDIEPYSALFGAVRNDDTFHLVLHLETWITVRPPGSGG